jgi:CheY-like chemotaxis protein
MIQTMEEKPPPRRRILVVDDELLIRTMMQAFLTREGWECLTASNPQEALTSQNLHPADYAIVDLHLGIHSGYDLIRALLENHPAMKIVAMTGSISAAQEAARAAGARTLLSKPFGSLNEVTTTLSQLDRG